MIDLNTYFLGLGGNLGDVSQAFHESMQELKSEGFRILACSSIYLSPALQLPDSPSVEQPDYLNAVIKVSCDFEPADVLSKIKQIEVKLGRKKGAKWGARPIDIDIVASNARVVSLANLKIPHAEMHNRLFVLLPLKEIEPNWIHPVTSESIEVLTLRLMQDSSMRCEKYSPFQDCECE